MTESNDLDEILTRLNALVERDDQPRAMLVVAPDQADGILGNRGGFLRLAVSALKAAKGEAQSFKGADWVYQNDLDWLINGLTPD